MSDEDYSLVAWLLLSVHHGYDDLSVPFVILGRYEIQFFRILLIVIHSGHDLIHFIAHGNFVVGFDDALLCYQLQSDLFDSFAQFSVHIFPPNHLIHLKQTRLLYEQLPAPT